jgi:ribosomal protein S18 acetylase RimI-like enzyme
LIRVTVWGINRECCVTKDGIFMERISMNSTVVRGSITTLKPILDMYYIREMNQCDLGCVALIERTSQETFWDREDLHVLSQESGIQGRVITLGHEIVGYYMFQIQEDVLYLLNLTLTTTCRGQKIGSTVLSVLKRDYLNDERTILACHVRDSNLAAHLFLRSNKFRAQTVERAHFIDYVCDCPHYEDAYYFTFVKTGRYE